MQINQNKVPQTTTKLELRLLNAIALDEYTTYNGAMPKDSEDTTTFIRLGAFAQFMGVGVHTAKGVLGSTVKKGLVILDELNDGVTLSPAGFCLLKENADT